MSEARILTDDELRRLEALQVTPGSWRVLFGVDVTSAEDDADAGDLAVADCGAPSMLTPEEQRQNAQLIAAAPDLRRTALHLLQQVRDLQTWQRDVLEVYAGGDVPADQLVGALAAALRLSVARFERARRAEAECAALRAHVTELEAPGECQSLHKLRAEVARLQAELVKPVLLPWQKHETREIWVRRDGGSSGLPLMVSERGWSAWLGAPHADVRGSETGEEGRRLADAAAVAAGWRLL